MEKKIEGVIFNSFVSELIPYIGLNKKKIKEIARSKHLSISVDELLSASEKVINDDINLLKLSLSLTIRILESIIDLIPSKIDNSEDKDLVNRLVPSIKKGIEYISMCYDSLIEFPRDTYTAFDVRILVSFNILSIMSVLLFQNLSYLFYGSKKEHSSTENTLNIIMSMIDSFDKKINSIAVETQQVNNGIKTTNKEFSVLNKKTDQILNGEENIQREIIIQSDKTTRQHTTLLDKINKRNQSEKRKTLTQEECAEMLFKQKQIYYQKRMLYLHRVGRSGAVVPKLPKGEKIVERTIQRWDQYLSTNGEKGTKPPKGYSRERTEAEFVRWAEVFEQIAYEKWEKKQPAIMRKNQITDGIVENFSQEDEENLEEVEDDLETRGKRSLADVFDYSRKR